MKMDQPPDFIYIGQGQFAVSSDPKQVFSTVLGSCVSACLFDPIAGVGGMNHFLLPTANSKHEGDTNKFGAHSMEMLVNELIKTGATRETMVAKAFGGANVTKSSGMVGRSNAQFVLQYLANEGIACIAHSLGNSSARQLRFWPGTGKAKVKQIDNSILPEVVPMERSTRCSIQSKVTLF